tara:strand:- start:4075 stop:4371 length:297 start_codon:yes stop_codon:yes gene_type:complete
VEVETFQSFAFGDVLLLCLSGLRGVTLHQLPSYTRLCILTRSSKVERKPPRLRRPAQPKAKPEWQDYAHHHFKWNSLRGQLDQTKARFFRAPDREERS